MFTLRKIEGGRINVFEPAVYPVGSTAVTEGEALVLSNGTLAKCGQEATPTFIALESGAANAEIHVGRVESNQVYETAAVSGVTLGAKCKLTTDATGILATTASTGGAEVVAINENSIYVRF